MKRPAKAAAAFISSVLLAASLCTAGEATKITVIEPSPNQRLIEAGRDFYVIGRIDREGLSAAEMPVDIRVEVVRKGSSTIARTVQSHVDSSSGTTPERDIMFNYKYKAPWCKVTRESLIKSPMPDLIYKSGRPDTFYDPSIKASVTEDRFAVLVQGGCTKKFETSYDQNYKEDLSGVYSAIVSATSGGRVLASETFTMDFGIVPDKLLSRFSPNDHMKAVTKFSADGNFRVYKDLFAGYWPTDSGIYEIPPRWRMNDSQEYNDGRVHTVIYNISEGSCATQDVEIAYLSHIGRLGSDAMHFYYYDIGEPVIKYRDSGGDTLEKQGRIVEFERGAKLAFTRAEFGPGNDSPRVMDLNVYDSVTADRDKTLTLCGAVTPIQTSDSDVACNPDATYTTKNKISSIHYEFRDGIAGVMMTADRPVGIIRNINGRKLPSVYEFSHDFSLPASLAGHILTVHAAGYDSHGAKVKDSDNYFYLRVK